MQPFIGFAPDVDPTTPGAILECENLTLTERGVKAMPSLAQVGLAALPAECRGFVVALKLDESVRIIAGTQTGLFEGVGGAWNAVSKAGGYVGGAENRWRFAQFGNVTIAANRMDPMQQSQSGAFADVPTAPKASIVETVAGFVMAFDTNDGTYGDRPDGWWCSALYDNTNWTPSIATQAANGRLLDTPGAIRAARALGDGIVVYKDRSMYLGQYAGPPVIWQWQRVPGEIGAVSQEAVVSLGTAHVFLGYDNFYLFDGSRPQPIADNKLKRWFFSDCHSKFRYRTNGCWDRYTGNVYWFYPSSSSTTGTLDSYVAYHVETGRWARGRLSVEAVGEYQGGVVTFDSLGSVYSTFDDLPAIAYASPFWNASRPMMALMDTSHTLCGASGASSGCSITTGDVGDDFAVSRLMRVLLRSRKSPASGSVTVKSCMELGCADDSRETSSTSGVLTQGRFDVRSTARYHRAKFDLVGDCELIGAQFDLAEAGTR